MATCTLLSIRAEGESTGKDYSNFVKIDGYEVAVQDVDFESGRVASGLMKRNKVGEKRAVNVTFVAGMASADIKEIMDKVSGSGTDHFFLAYADPTAVNSTAKTNHSGDTTHYYRTGKFYVGDRSFPRHSDRVASGWSEWSLNMVEF